MKLDHPKMNLLLEIIFYAVVLFFCYHSMVTIDFWFHLKGGEWIVQNHAIPFIDYFSHSVQGRPIIPYEWLYQVLIYFLYSIFGMASMGVMTIIVLLTYLLLYRQILIEIFNVKLVWRLFLTGILLTLTYTHWSERPQIFAALFMMLVLYLILKRIYLHKNYLYITIPIFWIWTNIHASMILGLALFFGLGGSFLLYYLKTKNKSDLKLARDLLIFAGINSVVTILPPLGTKVYELLWNFFKYRELISTFIDEWLPLSDSPMIMTIYGLLYLACLGAFSWSVIKFKETKLLWIFIPLLPVGFFALTGMRHAAFSLPIILLFTVPLIIHLKLKPKYQSLPFILALGIILTITYVGFDFSKSANQELDNRKRYYPTEAIEFIKSNLEGNMFNDYPFGGYLLYNLGPEKKVFIDGRTEMYLPEVFADYKGFSDLKYSGEAEILNYFKEMVDKYNISYAIFSSRNFTVWRVLFHSLYNQSDWHLVYFDDAAIIFVRDDGKNTDVINKYKLTAVTPFQKDLSRPDQDAQAINEYKAMNDRSPSSVASNSIGYYLFKQKNYTEAKKYFLKSLEIDPLNASSKVNLAEVYVLEQNPQEAIKLYEQVLVEEPIRASAYIRLGQLYIQTGRPKSDAINVWQKGINSPLLDDATKRRLNEQINSVSGF